MIFDKIISQYDEHSEEILFLIDKFKANKIIFIIDNKKRNKIKTNEKIYKKVFNNKEVAFEVIEDYSIDGLENILKRNSEALVNLSGGDRIISLLLLNIAMELSMQSIYIDFINKKRYVFKDKCRVINSEMKDTSLQEVFYLSGADVVNESTELCDKKDVIEISQKILSNIDVWHKYKHILYDNSIFKHNAKDVENIDIDIRNIDKNQLILLNKSIEYLVSINGIDISKNQNLIHTKFKKSYLKGVLFKSGTWLEVITYLAVKNIKEIDEVRSGVLFSWGVNADIVKNEIDVIAIKDSVLICISCKDSNKYDDDALNELSIYSERLGGKNVVKILVATKKPQKVSVIQRAKEMDINLVILKESSINYLQNSLRVIINEKIR